MTLNARKITEAANLGLPEPPEDAPPRSAQFAHMLYMAAYLPRLRVMDDAALKQVLAECGEHSQQEPLHLMPDAQFVVPALGPEPLTGNQVVSLMVCGLWVLCQEDAEAAHPLLAAWPCLAEALILSPEEVS